MTFYFLRHGATKGNLEKRYVGETDEALLPESCEALKALSLPPVKRVYVSPMCRCVETAKIVYPGAPLELVPDFRECGFGEFEYKNYEELKDLPAYQAWLDARGFTAFPGGESRADFCARVVRAFDRVAERAILLGGDAAIVAHGGTLMAILEARAVPKQDFYAWQAATGHGYAATWSGGALEVISSL
jgi:alpha-ribazole phosphatase